MSDLIHRAGMGFRRELLPELLEAVPESVSFFEVAPENWIGYGGSSAKQLRAMTERFPFVCHGLSLSLGGPDPLDRGLIRAVGEFMRQHGIALYTEHLSWCSDRAGRLYDLLPLPFTAEAVRWTAARIREVQDQLGQRIAIENASSYLVHPGAEMSEWAFIRAVIREADCLLHLDVNNLYVNSQNFSLASHEFLDGLPLEKVVYVHIAGHHQEADGLLVDTHGAPVIEPVWALLDALYQRIGPVPTCLERDFNFPPLAELGEEVARIRRCQMRALQLVEEARV
ncbi:MAG: hypothetical protein RIR00_2096 [Pseudomonadota bacterium]|jgi:uncharacterized protein (UPF0276 family)